MPTMRFPEQKAKLTGRERMAAMVERIFAGRMAADAELTDAAGGEAYPVKAILRRVDIDALDEVFDARAQQTVWQIDVPAAQAHTQPAKDAVIEILPGGYAMAGRYTVTEEAMATDRFLLIWRCAVTGPK